MHPSLATEERGSARSRRCLVHVTLTNPQSWNRSATFQSQRDVRVHGRSVQRESDIARKMNLNGVDVWM